MGLAEFALVSRKWKPAVLMLKSTNDYSNLLEYIAPNVLESRLSNISSLVQNSYPQIWIDTYLFVLAIFFVLFAAAFSIALQATASQREKLWYPLLILIVPVIIAFWTSRRRSEYYEKLKIFNELLQKYLKEFNSTDMAQQIKWQHRRLREDDTAESLALPGPLSRWQVVMIIEVIQIDPEDIHPLVDGMDMVLPSYNAAAEDIVLDIGPLDRTNRHPMEEQDIGLDDAHTPQSSLHYPLPPEYNQSSPSPQPRQEIIELTSISPSSPPTYHR
ncbi:hypothetical protein BCR42DRAFT_483145 [Absidia repens]|uniref:Uncharacterized protein n=1 Tax=Absidia repens TaxID=90262 RepID=A0A1X2ICE2_9FUNG|nr:hypothetical protein BCR42DRAFT_483145 [Absidia repens]